MEKAARAVIIDGKNIITIKRTKYDEEGKIKDIYYTIPGGHLENNETFEEAVIREVEEEISIKIDIIKEFAHIYNEDINKEEIFYYAKIKSGKVSCGNGPEFSNPNLKKYGKYEIKHVAIKDLSNYKILPECIKEIIIKEL